MGRSALDANGVRALAALPSLDELRAKIIGLIQAPATKIAQVVNAPATKVARVLRAHAEKSEAA
jgi:large subunit ribosomal protein L10